MTRRNQLHDRSTSKYVPGHSVQHRLLPKACNQGDGPRCNSPSALLLTFKVNVEFVAWRTEIIHLVIDVRVSGFIILCTEIIN